MTAPFFNIIQVLGEVGHLNQWVPITPESTVLHEVSYLRKLVKMRNSLSFPFTHREIFLEGSCFVMEEEKAVAITMNSVKDDNWMGYKLQRDANLVTTDVNKGILYVKPLGDNKN